MRCQGLQDGMLGRTERTRKLSLRQRLEPVVSISMRYRWFHVVNPVRRER